jgi:hypothetical protein
VSAHWCVFCPFHGQGEILGDNFAITSCNTAPFTDEKFALYFAHEFGHCLGLRHGPNSDFVGSGSIYYRSIMNGLYFSLGGVGDCQTSCASNAPGPPGPLNYSTQRLGPFVESALDEAKGICIVDGVCVGPQGQCYAYDFKDDMVCPNPNLVQANLNGANGVDDILEGRDDWKTLRHFNNSRAERADGHGGSTPAQSDCTGLVPPP